MLSQNVHNRPTHTRGSVTAASVAGSASQSTDHTVIQFQTHTEAEDLSQQHHKQRKAVSQLTVSFYIDNTTHHYTTHHLQAVSRICNSRSSNSVSQPVNRPHRHPVPDTHSRLNTSIIVIAHITLQFQSLLMFISLAFLLACWGSFNFSWSLPQIAHSYNKKVVI